MKSIVDFRPGNIVIIKQFTGSLELQSRLVEMGFVENIMIRIVKFAPWKGLIEVKIRNYHVSLRVEEGREIEAELYESKHV